MRSIARGELIEVDTTVLEKAECDAQHIGDPHVGKSARAQQDPSPAQRRQIHRRDHGQCKVPGCRRALYTDIHHIRFREEGGTNDARNLILLCDLHHQRVHDGLLIIEGDVEAGLRFLHADGTRYGAPEVSPQLAGAFHDAYLALLHFGVTQSAAKNAIAAVRNGLEPGAPAEAVLKAALAVAYPSPARVYDHS